jgi:hypothetical protein
MRLETGYLIRLNLIIRNTTVVNGIFDRVNII